MTLRNDQIPAESRIGLVALHASTSPPASTLARIRGELLNEGAKQNRYAKTPAGDMASYRTQQREQLGIAVTEPAKVGLAWSPAMESLRLLRGTRLPVELMVLRSEETARSFRVRLLTTQATQKKTINKNNRTSQVDDLERSLRLDGDPVFEPAATTAVVHLLVPADLPDGKFGVAFVAELLSPDKKTVIARSSTAVRNLETGSPLSIELASSDVVEAKSGRGESGILSGQVIRAPGFQQPVTVTLTSLPHGIVAPRQRLAADQTEFALPVGLPFGMRPGALTGIQLVATATVALERPSRRIQSNRIPISLQIIAGEKPLAESPWEVFEDAPEFAGYFSQGTGQVSLDTSQPYAGTASLKITPSSRSNANIPSLGLKIRERPATGEYRYLRFAWKKKGGASICVELNHDGVWGPSSEARPGAMFRYHAGPAGACYDAALILDEELPEDFVVIPRDLFADFGEFTWTGMAITPVDGEYALLDHVYLGRSPGDFSLIDVMPNTH